MKIKNLFAVVSSLLMVWLVATPSATIAMSVEQQNIYNFQILYFDGSRESGYGGCGSSAAGGTTASGSGIYSVDNKNPGDTPGEFHPGDHGFGDPTDPYTYQGGDSIEGIKEAIKKGYPQIDQDTRMTKDGVPVLLHNATPASEGFTGPGANKDIADLTLDQVKQLTNHGVHIATLEEVLSYVKGQGSDIVVQVEWKPNHVITEQEISTIANLYNEYGVRGAFKGNGDKDNISESLHIAQAHGFWVRTTEKSGASNGWTPSKWTAPTVTSAPSSTTSNGACTCGGSGSSTLEGSDNQEKIWNYLTGKGLSAAAAAGIMGNMSAESSMNPTAEQTPGAWEDMSTDRGHAVGLVQWDGGRRPAVIKYLESQGLTDDDFHKPSDKLLQAELDYVWKELSSSYQDALSHLKAVPNTKDGAGKAAYYFHKYYEISSDTEAQIQQNRIKPAEDIFAKYSGISDGSSGSSGSTPSSDGTCNGGTNNTSSPDCKTAAGTTKILCEAKKYAGMPYEESIRGGHQGGAAWHNACPNFDPKNPGPGCVLDCSGLINIAVYDAFGVDLRENTAGERADIGKYWKKISSSEAKAGDIFQPNTGHVEIVDHITGGVITAFGAHHPGSPAGEESYYHVTSSTLFLRYIGPGAS